MEELETYVACDYCVLDCERSGSFTSRECGGSNVSYRLLDKLGLVN